MSLKLEEYGFVGDTHTAALVGINRSIDWMCLPRFDSDACFAAILGTDNNGCWRIAPGEVVQKVTHSYRKETLILETVFETKTGAVRLIDFMPPRESCPHLVRIVEGIRGEVVMAMKLVVRFDYGVTVPWVRTAGSQSIMIAGPHGLVLRTDVKTRGEDLSTVAEVGNFPQAFSHVGLVNSARNLSQKQGAALHRSKQ
jgi:GH15 family glucan-1,4-alpha-glucosidase